MGLPTVRLVRGTNHLNRSRKRVMNEDSKEIGILAVDDHPLLRPGIAGLIRQPILRLVVFAGGCVLALLAGQVCQKSDKPAAGIVLTLIDQGWWVDKESR